MVTTVPKWSGRETRALREAMRMSVRNFAAHLGVGERTVSKWEAGGNQILPRPDTQAILDTALEKASREAQARFGRLVGISQLPGLVIDGALAEHNGEKTSTAKVRHPVDGKLMAFVEAGVYLSGRDNEPIFLGAFYMDVSLTTNADYERFVTATNYQPPSHWLDRQCPNELRSYPVVNVTYWDAHNYATWAKKSLPTAAEWEKAARGSKGSAFPWGNQSTPAKCNVRETGVGRLTPVNRYHSGVSHYGIYDMSGNVWEWCCTETEPGRFMLKGSAFTSPLDMASGAAINDASAEMLDDDTGFRCVSPPDFMEAHVFGATEPST